MGKISDYEDMAMLDLPDDERKIIGERFDEITGEFSALEQYDTTGVEPLVTVIDLHHNVLREDIPAKFMPREELLENAPEQHEGYFQVPGTLDN